MALILVPLSTIHKFTTVLAQAPVKGCLPILDMLSATSQSKVNYNDSYGVNFHSYLELSKATRYLRVPYLGSDNPVFRRKILNLRH
jgi:hypothetical protein